MIHGADIRLTRVSVDIGGKSIVGAMDLYVNEGEFVCLLGPSGCGKSTLLNVIAGFLKAGGTMEVGGKLVRGPGIERGMVFQSTEVLFPWLTVRQNVEYGPRMRGIPARRRAEMADHFLRMVGLGHVAAAYPPALSGGMRQRVQIARVLVNEPSVILMDEPFGALDAQTREIMQTELARIWRETRSTVLFVTHDIWEAIVLGDRIVTMTAGPSAGIKSIADVDFPGPRDATNPAAAALYSRLRDDIGAEVSKVLRQQGLDLDQAA